MNRHFEFHVPPRCHPKRIVTYNYLLSTHLTLCLVGFLWLSIELEFTRHGFWLTDIIPL